MKSIILDTNVIARYLLADIPDQFEKAKEIFLKIDKGEIRAFISILVIDELIWALENYYSFKRSDYLPSILKILYNKETKIIETKKEAIIEILENMKNNKIDFTDFYLHEIAEGRTIVSFDKDFKKIRR